MYTIHLLLPQNAFYGHHCSGFTLNACHVHHSSCDAPECFFMHYIVLSLPPNACFYTQFICCYHKMPFVASECLLQYTIHLFLPRHFHVHHCSVVAPKCFFYVYHCSLVAYECLFLYSIVQLLSMNVCFCMFPLNAFLLQHYSVIASECPFLYSIVGLLSLNARFCRALLVCCL